jgi:hypothetical protein
MNYWTELSIEYANQRNYNAYFVNNEVPSMRIRLA